MAGQIKSGFVQLIFTASHVWWTRWSPAKSAAVTRWMKKLYDSDKLIFSSQGLKDKWIQVFFCALNSVQGGSSCTSIVTVGRMSQALWQFCAVRFCCNPRCYHVRQTVHPDHKRHSPHYCGPCLLGLYLGESDGLAPIHLMHWSVLNNCNASDWQWFRRATVNCGLYQLHKSVNFVLHYLLLIIKIVDYCNLGLLHQQTLRRVQEAHRK